MSVPPFSRRDVVGMALALPLATSAASKSADSQRAFLWGAATAGHQVEGNNVASDIWLLEHVAPTVFAEPSGDACDSLNRWREDVGIVQSLGLNCYRFSIEWSRIEPARGQFSQAYLNHYARMVEMCRAQGIAPVVTLNHMWTTPTYKNPEQIF